MCYITNGNNSISGNANNVILLSADGHGIDAISIISYIFSKFRGNFLYRTHLKSGYTRGG